MCSQTLKELPDEGPTEYQQKIGKFVLLPLCFIIGIVLGNINKYIYTTFSFEFPLMITTYHMLFSWVACRAYMFYKGIQSVDLSMHDIVYYVAPVAFSSAISIGCANIALVYIYPSLHETINAATPLVTVLLCSTMLKQRFNTATWLCLIPVCGGSLLCVGGASDFHIIGVICSALSLASRGVKNTLQGYLLCDLKLDPVELLSLVAPIGLAIFAMWSILQEGTTPYERLMLQDEGHGLWLTILASCIAACSYNICLFVMVKYLNVVVVSVLNSIRVPCVILASLLFFGNSVSLPQIIGFCMSFAGVYLHSKYGKKIEQEDDTEMGEVHVKIVQDVESGSLSDEEPVYHKHVSRDALTGTNHNASKVPPPPPPAE